MTLDTTETWRRKDVALWEMIKEVFVMVTDSCPNNPFKLDHAYLAALPLEEAMLLTGSLLNFLQHMWIQADPNKEFIEQVYEDIKLLQTRHLNVMYEYTNRNIKLEEEEHNEVKNQ
ncbi:hypothetical protein INT45_004929 [Circinella minor]|uniref:DUF7886 domain-containing protein n=1 Tax=Circinella minor TaxID=1195481 RepID=A0A8H7RX97_9FUNG|nr:hypothetical protein INT45_004929 [Circinella minor]